MSKKYGETGYTIEQAAEIMEHVIAHMIEGGSFRQFIYGRLGFEQDAYVPLYTSGIMNFTNACPVNLEAEVGPCFIWAGAHKVLDVSENGIKYEYVDPFNGKLRTRFADEWPGQKPFKAGETCLVVYYSTGSGGRIYALKSDANQHYGAHLLEKPPADHIEVSDSE